MIGGGPESVDNASSATTPPDQAAALQQIHHLLQAKDDTSRFVGLALLKSVLDNQPLLRDDNNSVVACWNAIPGKFLDRLLSSGRDHKNSKDESANMIDIAVNVLHTFAVLLPETSRRGKKFINRSGPLLNVLITCSVTTSLLVLETLLTICSLPEGGLVLLSMEELSPLTEIAPQQPLALQVISAALATTSTSDVSLARSRLDSIVTSLVAAFGGTDAVTLLAFVSNLPAELLGPAIGEEELEGHIPKWVNPMLQFVRTLVVSRPNAVARAAYTEASAVLLATTIASNPALLFTETRDADVDEKPFSYLFINLLLIDIRTTLPTLISKLNNAEYPATSKRLIAAIGVVERYVSYLMKALDAADEDGNITLRSSFTMAPDLLLQIRKNLAETISVVIEYLRDRWDASVAGVFGLHPSAREGPSVTSAGSRLTLGWDSIDNNLSSSNLSDRLVVASLGLVALYVSADENTNLRNECAGLMDMFIELYKRTPEGATMDPRPTITVALESIMESGEVVETFLAQGGWKALASYLTSISEDSELSPVRAIDGINTVRVLLRVIDSDNDIQEEWMGILAASAAMKITTSTKPVIVEFQVAVLQLAVSTFDMASSGMQKRHARCLPAIRGAATLLLTHIRAKLPATVAAEFADTIKTDVLATLDSNV